MIDTEHMTRERYESLFESAGVKVEDLQVIVLAGPAVLRGSTGPLLVVDEDHYKQFMKVYDEFSVE